MDRKKVLLQAIESGFEVTSEGIPCETEYAKEGYALDYVIEGNDGGVGDLTEDQKYKIPLMNHGNGNLFNYTEPKNDNQVKADKDGWFDITIDNSTGTSTVYKNCWTNINPVLKPDTRYYLYTEIAEQSGDIVYMPCSTSANSLSQSKWGLNTPTGYITTLSDFTDSTCMLRTFCACTAGKSGHIKFRIAVYEAKQDTFTPYVMPQTAEILLDAPLMSGESIRYTSDNLPPLPLQEDGNTVTVNTTVQPSKLAVTYRAKVK